MDSKKTKEGNKRRVRKPLVYAGLSTEKKDKILKGGKVKDMINLYFTDLAHYNTSETEILTEEEKSYIFNKVKLDKDIKYWSKLRGLSTAFLMYKPDITAGRNSLTSLRLELSTFALIKNLHLHYENVINSMIDGIEAPDNRTKVTLIAKSKLGNLYAKIKEGKIKIDDNVIVKDKDIEDRLREFNETTKTLKELVTGIELFISDYSPLDPYKIQLKREEDLIKDEMDETVKSYNSLIYLQPLKKYTNIHLWDEIEVNITEEDIENIKNTAL